MIIELKSIEQLYLTKNSDSCIFLGCGPSIREITEPKYEKLKKFDVWSLNNFLYHPFIIPDYYHVELKKYDFNLFKERIKEKDGSYDEVKFIIDRNRTNLVEAIGKNKIIYGYNYLRYRCDEHGKAELRGPIDANFPMDPILPTKSFNFSITLLFDLMYKMGYSEIILIGVDIKTSLYFWSDKDPMWGKVHCLWNKDHEGRRSIDPHITFSRVPDFIYDFNNRFMKPKKREIFVGNKDTLLYPVLKYKKVF